MCVIIARMTWCVLGLVVVVIAGFDGGPKSIDDWNLSRLLGSNPSGEDPTEPLPDCNAISVGWVDCDRSVNDNPCGEGCWVAISATKGGINNKRYDPDSAQKACRFDLVGCAKNLFHEKKESPKCTPTKVN